MAKTHKGMYQYTSDEGANIGLGQTGFKFITATGSYVASADANNSEWFVAFKSVGTSAKVSGTSLQGDHFSTDGASAASGNVIELVEGEMIWGCFSTLYATLASTEYIIAYYG